MAHSSGEAKTAIEDATTKRDTDGVLRCDATAALIAFPHSASARRHMRQLVVYAPDAIVGRPGAPYLAVARLRGKRNAAARRRTAARLEKLRLMQLGVFCFPRRRAAPASF